VRIARLSDGTVAVDPTGKGAGRGAYVCRRRECCQDARLEQRLGRALRTTVVAAHLVGLRASVEAWCAGDTPGADM
jgi:uncharacterized protein